jgi:hypothetical protein
VHSTMPAVGQSSHAVYPTNPQMKLSIAVSTGQAVLQNAFVYSNPHTTILTRLTEPSRPALKKVRYLVPGTRYQVPGVGCYITGQNGRRMQQRLL